MSALPWTPSSNNIAERISTDSLVPSPPTTDSPKPQECEDDTNDPPSAVSAMSIFSPTSEDAVKLTIPSEVQNDKPILDADSASSIQNTALEPRDRTPCKQSQTIAGSVTSDIEGHPDVTPSPGATSQQGMSLASHDKPFPTKLDARADQYSTSRRDSEYFSDDSKRFSNASTLAEYTLDLTQFPSPSEQHRSILVQKSSPEFKLTESQVQHVIRDADTSTLFREDLNKFLLTHYRLWQENGIWGKQQHGQHVPLSGTDSNSLQRAAHLIRMGKTNENEAAICEVRDLIILQKFIKEFDYLEMSLDNSVLLHPGKRGATAVIDMLLQNSPIMCTREEVARMLKRGRRFKRITDKLGIAMVLVGGPYLGTVL